MYAEFYKGTSYVDFALVGFMIFFVFFLGVLAWVIVGNRGKARLRWEQAANLPLDGDERPHAHAGTGRES